MTLASHPPALHLRKPWQRAAALVAVLLALGGAFALYQRPDFLVMLADQAWSCF